MDLNDLVRSDEGMSINLSMPSGPYSGDFLALESMRIDTPSSESSPSSLDPLHQVNAPGYSHTSDGFPSKLLSDYDVCHDSLQESQDVYKQTLKPDVYTDILNGTEQPAEYYTERSRCSVDSSNINPSVCATADDFDAVTKQAMGQHMPNRPPSGHQPTDVGNALIDNVLSISSPSTVYSGLLADGDLHSDIQYHTITDGHEPSLLPSETLTSSEGTSDDCLQSITTPNRPERHAALSRSLLLKSSHASYNAYNNNNTAGSGSELVTDETLTSHAENFACSHKNTPIDFAPNHSSISQIDYTEASHLFQAPSPDSVSQDLGIEDFNSSPPSSPSMSSAYMLSSSPIPSSSPVKPSFQTPPTSPPSSPVKDTQADIESSNNELSISSTHHKFKNISMDERYTAIPLSGFAGQHTQSMASPDGSTLPFQHQASRVAAKDSSNTVDDATTTNAEDETGFSNESNVEQKKLDSNDVDVHRLKSMDGIPHPKRPTIAAHRLQQKKLAKPFRSPVLPQAPKLESKPKASATDLRADAVSSAPKEGDSQEHVPSSSSMTLDSKIKYRTRRAATQFKSPLPAPNALDNSSLVRLTPTIQALERKLQILKRAVKVREDVQEEVLEGLVKKWTEAGREVAWEVWNLVKDNASSDGGHCNSQGSKKRTFKGSWGWESPGDAKKPRGEETERNWGWDVVPISNRNEEEEEDAPKHTLGTMLRQLGVAADTLGWDDEEGSFIDR